MRKRPLKALLPIFLAAFFLLNTLAVIAAESDRTPLAVTESVTDSGRTTTPDKLEPEPIPEPEQEDILNDAPSGDWEDGAEPPEGSTPPEESPPVWLEVATFEELDEALEASTPLETMRLRLTGNITVPAIAKSCVSGPDHPVELNLGPYTLYVEGSLTFQSGLTLTGSAGKDALIRVRPGGSADIRNVQIRTGERYAVWQEEGAVFTFTPTPDFSGKVHYAEKAVAMPHSFISWKVAMPVAVVHDDQTLADVLPDTDSVQWFYKGKAESDENIAVDWDIAPHQTELDTRIRTVITGSYPDAIALKPPVCLVVFQNGNPAIFLDAYGMESYGWPKAKVKIELLEPELGCRFEWSQDGENWLSAAAVETPTWDGRLAFTVSFPQDTPPAYPYYLSAVVDYPDGSTGYSDLLVIREADSQCDSGGNRHGGTGVTPPDPPALGGGTEGGGGTDDTTPDEPDDSGRPQDTAPLRGRVAEASDGTQPPAEHPPIGGAGSPGESVPPTDPPGQSAPPTGSEPPAQSAQPSPSASPPASDGVPSPQIAADVKEAMVQTGTQAPVRDGAAPNAKAVAQVAVGVAATGGMITLTMTWGSWSKRLLGLLRKLLKG